MDESIIGLIGVILQFGPFILLLVITYFVGNAIEKAHYRNIIEREHRLLQVPTTNFPDLPVNWVALQGELVMGGVVVSVDYFKRFLAALRNLVGGRVKSYESLLDRGRREALLRMKELAVARGYNAVINVRLETSKIASAKRRGREGVAGVEILAFGTAVKIRAAQGS